MKTKITTWITSIMLVANVFSQQEEVIPCYYDELMHYSYTQNDEFLKLYDKSVKHAAEWQKLYGDNEELVIPVVVHVVYRTENENLSDALIHRQIEILNEHFGATNADVSSMRPIFQDLRGNPRIRFQLAKIDPNGNPTTGIVRRETTVTGFGSFYTVLGSFNSLEKVKSTSLGGSDQWNPSKYLNIWICNMGIPLLDINVSYVLGYATPPVNLPNWPANALPYVKDGVVVNYTTISDQNPNVQMVNGAPYTIKGKVLIHEIGHYLGLRHISGDGNCTASDGVDDTPKANGLSTFNCDKSKNTCVDDINGVDYPDMVENYMDYSSDVCQVSFTHGQSDLMRGVINTYRRSLILNNNVLGDYMADAPDVKFFPNPFEDVLTIQTNATFGEVLVLDAAGKEIFQSKDVVGDKLSINTATFVPGIYIVKIRWNDGNWYYEKMVKY